MESFRAMFMASLGCFPIPNTKITAIAITCLRDCWRMSRFWKPHWEGRAPNNCREQWRPAIILMCWERGGCWGGAFWMRVGGRPEGGAGGGWGAIWGGCE